MKFTTHDFRPHLGADYRNRHTAFCGLRDLASASSRQETPESIPCTSAARAPRPRSSSHPSSAVADMYSRRRYYCEPVPAPISLIDGNILAKIQCSLPSISAIPKMRCSRVFHGDYFEPTTDDISDSSAIFIQLIIVQLARLERNGEGSHP